MSRIRNTLLAIAALTLSGCVYTQSYYLNTGAGGAVSVVLDVRAEPSHADEHTPVPTMYATQEHAPTGTPTPEYKVCTVVVREPFNAIVRACGDVEGCAIIGAQQNGAQVDVVRRVGNWYEIAPRGWISARLVEC